MWIYMNNSFLSIVESDELHLTVCAHRQEDIGRIFPDIEICETPERDYRYRAVLQRRYAAIAIAQHIMRIGYCNLKDSVKEDDRLEIYSAVRGWTSNLQK